jgi:hypothetical protein
LTYGVYRFRDDLDDPFQVPVRAIHV